MTGKKETLKAKAKKNGFTLSPESKAILRKSIKGGAETVTLDDRFI